MRRLLVVLALVAVVVGLLVPGADARRRTRWVMSADTNRVAPGACSGNASGDYDGNASNDLAIGSPGEDVGGDNHAGVVHVLYGSDASTGLTVDGQGQVPSNQLWSEKSAGIPDTPQPNDMFGRCVVAGDVNGDGFGDLIVGAPGEHVNGNYRAGAITVIYGSPSGLNASSPIASQEFTMATPGIGGTAQPYQDFGASIATGDFNHDGFADVAAGAPLRNVGGAEHAGAVVILFGSDGGLTTDNSQFFTQDTPNVADAAENNDHFGASLATGDANGDGFSDLAIGVPEESLGPNNELGSAGAVHVFYGGPTGLSPQLDELWTQDRLNLEDNSATGDNFGWSVAFGDTNSDGYDDLAASAPFETVNGNENAGSTNLIMGSATGLTDRGARYFTEDNTGGTSAKNSYFGASLVLADFNGSSTQEDLAIGVPGKNMNHIDVGAVYVLYANSGQGLKTPAQIITQDTPDVEDKSEPDDRFGMSVSAGRYNADSFYDLAIGVPGEVVRGDDVAPNAGEGAVNVIYGSSPALSPTAKLADQFFSERTPGMLGTPEPRDEFGRSLG